MGYSSPSSSWSALAWPVSFTQWYAAFVACCPNPARSHHLITSSTVDLVQYNQRKLLLVLDLDHTLVYAVAHPDPAARGTKLYVAGTLPERAQP